MTEYPYLVAGINEAPRGVLDRHTLTSLESDERRVSFYCAAPSHADDPWFVASFVYVTNEAGSTWAESPNYPMRGGVAFWIGFRASDDLIGNQRASADDSSRFYDPGFRLRYKLRCRTCGLRLARRSDTIQADLEKLWQSGVLEVPLAAYAATV
ncbi:hypothetical protein J4G33_07855 [Actinotalea sp. BY-33]|uniref:Uncharacterized protein n=1 Tax=Actinotalea soli TaxID=2819234 RepID=A0A939LQ52_9CELL|nr:hypothetical protein [Actinotalea soli]MBO1751713.1 hypothetical protein [Actinotalea soli]